MWSAAFLRGHPGRMRALNWWWCPQVCLLLDFCNLVGGACRDRNEASALRAVSRPHNLGGGGGLGLLVLGTVLERLGGGE